MSSESNRINFTKATLLALPTPAPGKRATYYDTKTRGLNLVVTDAGTKTFYLRRKLKGASERVVIGRFPDFTIEQARGKAGEINSAFSIGKNPADLRRLAKGEPTLGQLFDEYVERYAKDHTKTWEDMEANFRRYLSQWKARKVSTLSSSDVQRLHAELGRTRGHHTANRAIELLRALFNKGISWGLCPNGNPASRITKFRLKSRERFIYGEELPRFFRALAEESNKTIRDYVLISLLTGARKSNVISMRWDEISFERSTWRIPETKNGEPLTVPLTPVALEVLKARAEQRTNDYVFPGDGAKGHLISPKKGWKRILQRAKIKDLRIHDLRRTMGSWQASTGASLAIIGKSLGHKDFATTAIYARLNLDPVRQAMETATNAILSSAGVTTPAQVHQLGSAKRAIG